MKSHEFYRTTAWKWFSKYIILKFSNNGAVQCATSKKWYSCNDSKLHCGHLIKVFEGGGKTNFSTAFDERNVLPQSLKDNRYKGGCELKMMDAICEIYGDDTYNELKLKSKQPYKLSKLVLSQISDIYRIKFNELTKVKGNPWKK